MFLAVLAPCAGIVVCGIMPALWFHSWWWLLGVIPGAGIGAIFYLWAMSRAMGLGN